MVVCTYVWLSILWEADGLFLIPLFCRGFLSYALSVLLVRETRLDGLNDWVHTGCS